MNSSNISTLLTIIFGLMLYDLFASVHRLIRNRKRIQWHWLPILVAWYVLATVLKNWWALVFKGGEGFYASGWMYIYYAHLFLLLYLVVSAVLPDEIPADGIDLREFYIENRQHFWGLLAGVNLTLMIFALLWPIFSEQNLNLPRVISNIVMVAINISLARVKSFRYHIVVVVLFVVMVIFEMVEKF